MMNPLSWSLLTDHGIAKSDGTRFSGRVTDILRFGSVVVIATQWGGVWTIDEDVPVQNGFDTRPLSDNWDDPDVNCLANGPDGESQVYAGCSRTLTCFELAAGGTPFTSFVTNLPLPAPFTNTAINRIVVDSDPGRRRLILATDAGVCWSAIPADPGNASGYAWAAASGWPIATGPRVAGLCLAKGGAVHAAIWGPGTAGSEDYGIFKGIFASGGLVFSRSPVPTDQMTRVSLASCAANRDAAFAVFAAPSTLSSPKNPFGGLLQYDAASDAWTSMASPASSPGVQGNFNNCIAVAPDDASLVAFGWQAGTFVLHGGNWTLLANPKAHSDIHGLFFTKKTSGHHTLYVGGDGGILEVVSPAQTSISFDDRLNTFLPTLLFSNAVRGGYATLDASHSVDGLVAGGLQDNSVTFLKTRASKLVPWNHLEGGDGGTNVFVTNGVLVSREFNKSSRFEGFRFDATTNLFGPGFKLHTEIPVSDVPRMEVCSRVVTPTFRNPANQLLQAVSAAEPADPALKGKQFVMGLFGDPELQHHHHWSTIGTTPFSSAVTAVASMDGERIFVGVGGGVSALDAQTGASATMTLPPLPTGKVVQLEVVSASLVFALYAATTGHLLVFDGTSWKEIPLPVSEVVYSIAVDWSTNSVYLATDTSVYRGTQIPYGPGVHPIGFDTSFSWMNDSNGLPVRPHGGDLRLGMDRGTPYLYLSTYGRSVYRAPVSDTTTLPGSGAKAGVTIVFGVIQDGGGLAFDPSTGKFVIVPPRQPVEAVLADLLASERLRGNTSKEAVAQWRAALERVGAFVRGEIDGAKP